MTSLGVSYITPQPGVDLVRQRSQHHASLAAAACQRQPKPNSNPAPHAQASGGHEVTFEEHRYRGGGISHSETHTLPSNRSTSQPRFQKPILYLAIEYLSQPQVQSLHSKQNGPNKMRRLWRLSLRMFDFCWRGNWYWHFMIRSAACRYPEDFSPPLTPRQRFSGCLDTVWRAWFGVDSKWMLQFWSCLRSCLRFLSCHLMRCWNYSLDICTSTLHYSDGALEIYIQWIFEV